MTKNNIICDNCFNVIENMEDQSIDLLITDPPYEVSTNGGGFSNKRENWVNDVKRHNLDTFSPIPFLEIVKPKLKKFHAYIFTSKELLDVYIRWAKENNYGWEIIVMAKSNPIPAKNNKYLGDKEFCMFIREPGGCYFNNDADYQMYYTVKNTVVKPPQYGHPTEKPMHVIADFIKISSRPEDVIFDPYLGSGTTAVAAFLLGRNFIGVEIDEKFAQTAKRRVESHMNDMFLNFSS